MCLTDTIEREIWCIESLLNHSDTFEWSRGEVGWVNSEARRFSLFG